MDLTPQLKNRLTKLIKTGFHTQGSPIHAPYKKLTLDLRICIISSQRMEKDMSYKR